jgi:hypothetical protein
MNHDGLRKISSRWFADGTERDVFEDAEGRRFVEDDGELVTGQWLPAADDALIVELEQPVLETSGPHESVRAYGS